MTNKLKFDIAIIGAGSAGLSLASGAAQLGLKVALIEQAKMGGDCLNYGCVPSKALLAAAKSIAECQDKAHAFGAEFKFHTINFDKVMQHVHDVIKTIAPHDSVQRFESLGVEVFKASAHFIDETHLQAGEHVISAKKIVIATGASPFIPAIPGLDKCRYYSNETIFDLKALPKKLIIIGGGPIGCELAQAFAMLGSEVSMVEAMQVLPKDDEDAVQIIKASLKKNHVRIYENISIKEVIEKGREIILQCQTGSETIEIKGTDLLIATGRRANIQALQLSKASVIYSDKGITVNERLQTSNKAIYAIGDVVGPYQFTHMASYQAGVVLKNIVFKWPAKVNYQTVPWVTYTKPELAQVGLLAKDIKDRAGFQVTTWPFSENDRATTERETTGFIKVISNKKGKILGVTIVGEHAGELLLPWVIAMREGKTLRTFTDCICPYPTRSEISKQVAGAYYAPILFSKKIRTIVSWLNKLWG
jgi:pyruvate/2-oxoglutarate dehydrogenase complex dihydrolipoamide dehydrogenase (E3) component